MRPAPPPVLILTPGDPTGIGPEITAKFLASPADGFGTGACPGVHIVGDCDALSRAAAALNLPLPPPGAHVTYTPLAGRTPGDTAYRALDAAVATLAEARHAGQAAALVTGPISKAHLHAAGWAFNGHTELLAALAARYFPQPSDNKRLEDAQAHMLFVYRAFRVLLLTRHIPLRDVSAALTPQGVTQACLALARWLRTYAGIQKPRLGLMALNPHGRELDDTEDRRVFDPARQILAACHGVALSEPMPADALFRGFEPQAPGYDAYVSAYHDQGLIPMKLLAGLSAVNVTIGLPFVRTSVSHGMAADIVGRGIASPASLMAAWQVAQAALTHAIAPAKGPRFEPAL